MSQHRPGAEFSNVDQAIQPENLVQCLDFQSNTEFMQVYKQRTFSLLAIHVDQHILEVGCGTAQDAQEIAKYVGTNGRVIGQDISQTMIEKVIRSGKLFHALTSFITLAYKAK